MIFLLAASGLVGAFDVHRDPSAFACARAALPKTLLIVGSDSGFPAVQTKSPVTIDKDDELKGQSFATYNWQTDADGTEMLYFFGPKQVTKRQVLALAKSTDGSDFYVGGKIVFGTPDRKPASYTCKLLLGPDALRLMADAPRQAKRELK